MKKYLRCMGQHRVRRSLMSSQPQELPPGPLPLYYFGATWSWDGLPRQQNQHELARYEKNEKTSTLENETK
jgi:hypothetical protein